MENASKALIIAGAILLSIAIIGIGMYVYQMAAGTLEKTNLSAQQVTAYNADFDKYEGKQMGSTVRGLVDVIRNHNAYDDDLSHQIIFSVGTALDGGTVADDNAAGTTSSDLSTLKSQISAGGRYNITFQYTSGGLIKKIDATLVS